MVSGGDLVVTGGDIVVTGGDTVVTGVVLRSCRDTVLIVVALWWYCGHCGATVMIMFSLYLEPTRSWI